MAWLRVPYILLQQRYTGRQNQNAQPHGQQDLPSHLHELVKAITRERATIPDIEVHKPGNFRREPENVLHSKTDRWNKENQTDQAEHEAESGKPDGLNSKQGMLRHARRVVKTNRSEEQKCRAGDERKNLLPKRAAQPVRKRPQPSAQPERDRNR